MNVLDDRQMARFLRDGFVVLAQRCRELPANVRSREPGRFRGAGVALVAWSADWRPGNDGTHQVERITCAAAEDERIRLAYEIVCLALALDARELAALAETGLADHDLTVALLERHARASAQPWLSTFIEHLDRARLSERPPGPGLR